MSETSRRRAPKLAARQQGFVLVTGLLFLVVMTMLGLALFRGTGLMDRISANTRDKQRSFEAAQATLNYGAWWLGTSGGGGIGSSCASNSSLTVSSLHVCTDALPASLVTVAQLAWAPRAFTYTPPNMTVAAGGGLNSSGNDINYQAPPGLYVERLGLSADGSAVFYQLTAFGYGGDPNTVSVVRGSYKQTAKTSNLKKP